MSSEWWVKNKNTLLYKIKIIPFVLKDFHARVITVVPYSIRKAKANSTTLNSSH